MIPTKNIFSGQIVKNCTTAEIKETIRMLYLRCIATIGHTRPDADNLEISIAIVIDDLVTHFPFLHISEMDVIFHKGIRRELNEFTIFAPVEVYGWFKKWYESSERNKLRNEFLSEKNNLLAAAPETPKEVDYEKWLQEAKQRHMEGKSFFMGITPLYEYLVASNRIKRQWPEFRERGKVRMENQLLAGKTSTPLELRSDILKADTANDGAIKAVCIELAMEEFLNEMVEV